MIETKESSPELPDAGRMSLSEAPRPQGDESDGSKNNAAVDLNTSFFEDRASDVNDSRSQVQDGGGDSGKDGGNGSSNIDLNTSFSDRPDSAMSDIRDGQMKENANESQMDARSEVEAPQQDRSSEIQAASAEPASDALREE